MKKFLQELREIIRGGALHILSGSILVKAIAMISSVLVARIVDKNSYAYYSYASNFYQYISLIDGLGLATAMLIFCSAKSDPQKNKGFFNFAIRVGGSVQLAAAVLLCIVVAFIPLPFPQAKKYVYLQVLLPATSFILSALLIHARVQLENRIYSFSGIIQAVIILVVGTFLVWLFNAYGVIAANYLGAIATIAFVAWRFKAFLFSTHETKLTRGEMSKYIRTGISLVIATFFSSMMPMNETFLVNNIIQDEIVISNFKIAGLFPQQLLLVTGALMTYYFPVISGQKDPAQQWAKIKKIAMINFALVVLVAGLGALLTPVAIRILYGDKYMDAIPLTYMLWMMRTVNAAIRMVPMNMLPAIGCLKFNSVMAFVSCIIQVAIDYFLITYMGVRGAAYGAMIVYLLSGGVTWFYIAYVCKKRIRQATEKEIIEE